ncbi:Mv-ORF64 peptide [Maruca vitrata nucleopolyhedrovirus]|uniref:Mv-ORF64 peptide n=1 Tax=Maruca vitrata nucleopolyhedrovirus TaxID=1307954 RepID=A1YRC6_9ABAC|nr:Mv-ORF64 peptide [Maruca vitrata nucleopolyhedrovirus]ABL76016.1 Mv-ORF64 peptide [Maruca vitrata nucleopolyhedrovirus]
MTTTEPPLSMSKKETTSFLDSIWKKMSMTETFQRLRNKNLTTLNKVKYDSELLIHYLYDDHANKSFENNNINVIKISKVKVKKTGASMLAHYFAEIQVSTGYSFEFHPGSQPRTFQTIHTDGLIMKVLILCDECCKKELRNYIKGENSFNVAFKNCESILCRRISFQTVLLTCAILLLIFNVEKFSMINLLIILLILISLFCHNNYIISNPSIEFCNHKSANKKYDR